VRIGRFSVDSADHDQNRRAYRVPFSDDIGKFHRDDNREIKKDPTLDNQASVAIFR
jgi:hypothetical protein